MIRFFILLLCAYDLESYGYDSGGGDQAACGRPYRSGRMYQPPCDLNQVGYCASAGGSYPWHAVKRFVRDNQGLMRRMYGDQRHGHVLRVQLEEEIDGAHWKPPHKEPREFKYFTEEAENEVFPGGDDDEKFLSEHFGTARLLRDNVKNDDVLNTKFVYAEEAEMAIKFKGLKTASHSRPTTEKYVKDIENKLNDELNVDPVKTDATTITTTTSESTSTAASKSEATSKLEAKPTTESAEIEEDSTTDPTTDQTTLPDKSTEITETNDGETKDKTVEASDRVGEANESEETKSDRVGETNTKLGESDGLSTTESGREEGEEEDEGEKEGVAQKPGTVLFQDMEQDMTKKKMHVNFKMKGVNACPVKEEVVAPFWANNTRGEILALLNMYPFEQYVHWEKCTYEHRQMYCREGCRCEQQFRLHRLLAYDPNNECRGIFSDWFRFPSCCVCKCYNMPPEFRVTSRSPRLQNFPGEE